MNTKMENHQVLLESFNRTQNMELNTGVSVFPQQNITQPEIIQGTEPDLTVLALTEFRIQQLENRQFLLQEMLHITEKSKDNNNRPTEEMTSEDCDKLCELEIIQKELEELEMKKKELQKQETGSELGFNSEVTSEDCDKLCELEIIQKELEELGMKKEELQKQETGSELGFNSEAFEMDTLPSLQEMNEDVKESQEGKVEPTSEDTRGPVIPVDRLGHIPDVTKCPSCHEVVFTETCIKVGEATWIASCLCSMVGCVAGCCVIPFFLDRLKNVHHTCPHCHKHIHTFRPF